MSQFDNLQVAVPDAPAPGAEQSQVAGVADTPVLQYNTAHDIQVGSIRTPAGAPRAAQSASDDDIVRIDVGGYVTDVRYGTARDNGWLPKEAAPSATESTPAPSEQHEEQQAETPPVDPAADDKAALSEMLSPSISQAVMVRYLETGTVDASLVQGTGAQMEAVLQRVASTHTKMADDQGAALVKIGIDPNAFRAWTEKHHKAELHRAIREHYVTGNVQAYAGLAERYLTMALPSAQAIEAAGLGKTFTDPNTGKLMVRLKDGMTTTVAAAARRKLV